MNDVSMAPETPSLGSTAVNRLTDELVQLRRRGIERIDDKKAVALPILERLAQRHPGTEGTRPVRIRRLLSDALDQFGADESSADAAFIKSLLADEQGRWPGPTKPGDLQERAQNAAGIDDDREFRKYQRQRLAAFAHYLLNFSKTSVDDVPPPAPHRGLTPPRIGVAAVGAVVVIGGVILGIVLSGGSPKTPAAGPAGPSVTVPADAQVSFRFDNLGSTYPGGNTVLVFPGTGTSSADRQADGEYPVGDVVRAICIATGRMVKSDPAYNETPKRSDQWVRIASTDGQTQYATLTYGELLPQHAKLQHCSAASQ